MTMGTVCLPSPRGEYLLHRDGAAQPGHGHGHVDPDVVAIDHPDALHASLQDGIVPFFDIAVLHVGMNPSVRP